MEQNGPDTSQRIDSEIRHELEQPATQPRARRLLERLVSFYGIALAIGAGTTLLFAWLADEVLESEFADFNRSVLLAIHRHADPTLDSLALSITWFGSVVGVIVLTLLFIFWLVRSRRVVDAWILAVAMGGAGLLSSTLKVVFHQTRPEVFPRLAPAMNFSFPSGHSLMSFTYWGFLAVLLVLQNPRGAWRWGVACCALVLAGLVALSRLYIGVHWPTDVVAGMLLAIAWLTVCFSGRQWLAHRLESKRSATEMGEEIREQPQP
jgi:undecaprenyl-diphosphatase